MTSSTSLKKTFLQIEESAARLEAYKTHSNSRQSTGTSLVLPFIQSLGYDIFNISEVIDGYPGEEDACADYGVFHNGKIEMLFDCSPVSGPILPENTPGIIGTFLKSKASFLCFTNGKTYQFYTTGSSKSPEELTPVFTFSISGTSDESIRHIQSLCKTEFDADKIISKIKEAGEEAALTTLFKKELLNPSENFAIFCAGELGLEYEEGTLPEEFRLKVKKTFQEFLRKMINSRLTAAMQEEFKPSEPAKKESAKPVKSLKKKVELSIPEVQEEAAPKQKTPNENKPETTTGIPVQTILETIQEVLKDQLDKPERLTLKSTDTYYGIILDGKPRNRVCRIYTLPNGGFRINFAGSTLPDEFTTLEEISKSKFKLEESLLEIANKAK